MKYKIPIDIVEMDGQGCHLFVDCLFNKETEGKLIIDTGASKSVFDFVQLEKKYKELELPAELQSAGIAANMLESRFGQLKKFSVGKFNLKKFEVVLINMSDINELYSKTLNRKIWGLLGGDILLKYNAKIDYGRKLLILEK